MEVPMDDEIAQLLAGLVAIGLALVAVFFAIWIVVATLIRIFSYVVVGWALVGLAGVAAGLVAGVWVPVAVLTGRARTTPRLLVPDDVVSGKAFRTSAHGPSKHYGRDRAWPTYLPYQASWDARAVSKESWKVAKDAVFLIPSIDDPIGIGVAAFVAWPAVIGFLVGLAVSTAAWYVIMTLIGAVLMLGRMAFLWANRARDRITLLRRKATLVCVNCSAESKVPSYACNGTACTEVHRDIRPGRLGIIARRCGCGERLPTTITGASGSLTPQCPVCNQRQSDGAGARQTILVPVIGEVAAGKSRLLAGATVGLSAVARRAGGRIEGLSPESKAALASYERTIESGARTLKTPLAQQPRAIDLEVAIPGSLPLEVHLFDVAGEYFQGWDQTAKLRFLDRAKAMVFVIDPLAIPDVRRDVSATGNAGVVDIAEGQAEVAYASAIDRLRQEGLSVKHRRLAVVLSKADVLLALPGAENLRSGLSGDIRTWLQDMRLDQLVRRMDRDFAEIRYFLSDSMVTGGEDDPAQPVAPVLWVLGASGAKGPLGGMARREVPA
jgi:hypothetical protein